MRRFAPIILIAAAVCAGAFALLGDDSIANMNRLSQALEEQRARNDALEKQVRELRSFVRGLQQDPRILEKTARSELGMARPDEKVFVFRDESALAPEVP
jgi:cell division protein FtsB